MRRYLFDFIQKDLAKKAVLLSGPRQVGKTTLARSFFTGGEYLNYDILQDRKIILENAWKKDAQILILDEIHKLKSWKNYLKGIIDQYQNNPPLIVTGSARLETFRKAGDALTGRTFLYHLHPIDISEATLLEPKISAEVHLEKLLRCGGFPESFFSPEDAPRLLMDRFSTVLRDDIRDLSNVTDIKRIELLIELLRDRVGGQVNYANLAGDLGVSPPTIKNWIELLEKLFLVFLIRPFKTTIAKSLRKEPKCYFFDCSAATNGAGAKLENAVASALLKWCDRERETKGRGVELCYYRDSDQREIDFVVKENRAALACIEIKLSEDSVSKGFHYVTDRLKPKFKIQLVKELDRETERDGVKILHAANWLKKIEI